MKTIVEKKKKSVIVNFFIAIHIAGKVSRYIDASMNRATPNLKLHLFRAYCTNLYCTTHTYRTISLRQNIIISGYPTIMPRNAYLILIYAVVPRDACTVYNGILSLGELRRKYIYAFMQSISNKIRELCILRLWTLVYHYVSLIFCLQRYCTIFIFIS